MVPLPFCSYVKVTFKLAEVLSGWLVTSLYVIVTFKMASSPVFNSAPASKFDVLKLIAGLVLSLKFIFVSTASKLPSFLTVTS